MSVQSAEQDFERWRSHQDAAALGRVFDRLAPGLLIVAGHVAGRSHAEDLLQATFLHVIEHAERWDGERPLRPWMVGILVRLARRQLQRERRSVDPARLSEETAVADPTDLAAQQETAQRISAAVDGLPREYRRTLTLRFAHGLTPTEIAHADGEPLATVKSRLRRGLDLLRRSLPAGSQTLALGILTPRGLEAVRREVLARAAEHAAGTVVSGAAVAAGIGTGAVIVMKQTTWMAAAGLLALVGALVMVWQPIDGHVVQAQQEPGVARSVAVDAGVPSVDEPAAASVEREPVEGSTGTVKVEVPAGRSIRGQVVDADGVAVAGAAVLLALPGSSDEYESARGFLQYRHGDPAGELRLREGVERVTTDDAGRFGFAAVPSDDLHRVLVAWEPTRGCAHHELDPADAEPVLLRIPVSRPLSGRVCRAADGEPIATARVGVYPEGSGMPTGFLPVGKDGSFVTAPIPVGAYRLYAKADAYREQWKDLASGEVTVTFELEELPVLDVLLVDQHGAPWNRSSIEAVLGPGPVARFTLTRTPFQRASEVQAEARQHATIRWDATTGRLHGALLDPEADVLTAWRGPVKLGDLVLPSEMGDRLVLTLEAPETFPVTIAVEFVPPPEEAPELEFVVADPANFGTRLDPIQSVTTRDRVTTLALPVQFAERECFVQVTAAGYVESVERLRVGAPAAGIRHVARLLRAECTLRGRVVAPDGRPPVRAKVTILRPEGSYLRSPGRSILHPEVDGGFEFEGLPRGPLRILVEASDCAPQALDVELDGSDDDVEIRLEAGRPLKLDFGRAVKARLCIRDAHQRPLLDDRITGSTRYGNGLTVRVGRGAVTVEAYDAVTGERIARGGVPVGDVLEFGEGR